MSYALGFDIGGTFTDFALIDQDDGQVFIYKVLTTPSDPAVGALEGTYEFLADASVNHAELSRVLHASTLVTNALIERQGATVGLITTSGFRDVLEVGTEQRYDIYDLFLQYPDPLSPRRLRREVSERIDRDGRVLRPVMQQEVEAIVEDFKQAGVEAIAVCLLHAYRNDENEVAIADIITQAWPEVSLSLSSTIAPEIREYERTTTTVANAYVQPRVERYLARLRDDLVEHGVNGNLYPVVSTGSASALPEAIRQPIRLLESGPAAGAVLAGQLGELIGQPDVLSFDMGGTTAKLCLVQEGRPHIAGTMEAARIHRFKKGSGHPVRIPTVDMLEVGAGGGSTAWIDTLGLLKVGPESAGADPGPAAYGLGGQQPTVTDADLFLGYLNPEYFLGGEMPLHMEHSEKALAGLGKRLGLDATQTAAGIHRLVNDNMAAAARLHVLEQGRDPRRFGLVCFGGAGPVHAAGVAMTLGTTEVVIPDRAGVASAVGLLAAPMAFEFVRSFPTELGRMDWREIEDLLQDMEREGRDLLEEAGAAESGSTVERHVEGRFKGQLHEIRMTLPVDIGDVDEDRLRQQFNNTYELLYQHLPGDLDIEFLTWRTRVQARHVSQPFPRQPLFDAAPDAALKGRRAAYFDTAEGYVETSVYDRGQLQPGMQFAGPALIEEKESTTVVRPGMRGWVDEYGSLRLRVEGNEQ